MKLRNLDIITFTSDVILSAVKRDAQSEHHV